jgi:hypothetical protein
VPHMSCQWELPLLSSREPTGHFLKRGRYEYRYSASLQFLRFLECFAPSLCGMQIPSICTCSLNFNFFLLNLILVGRWVTFLAEIHYFDYR